MSTPPVHAGAINELSSKSFQQGLALLDAENDNSLKDQNEFESTPEQQLNKTSVIERVDNAEDARQLINSVFKECVMN